jgi:hypothetical protein
VGVSRKIFALNEDGTTYVIQTGQVQGDRPKQLDEFTLAAPAISNGSLFIRTATKLYRIDGRRRIEARVAVFRFARRGRHVESAAVCIQSSDADALKNARPRVRLRRTPGVIRTQLPAPMRGSTIKRHETRRIPPR